ncbi:D-ribitol-5-phosphate cytidylyltransferase-like isoform X2 [Diadema antillarum]|uniref:D-ribitol-5-phosphate cytidylyltransferase-like isoform X2 n=1 Tax=Diadema antillarum TaxID=105358 RepID=UPI003A88AD98
MTGLVFAIIPAAGTGERTGLEIPKQFCHIAGHPLILHTLQCFQRSWIDTVVVAVSSDWLAYVQDLVDNHCLSNVRLVLGGDTRHLSIKNCVEYVQDKVVSGGFDQSDVTVIVHDAVRPFVAEETLKDVAAAAHKQGASGVVCPLVSTTLATRPDGILDYSLVRSKHRNSHTPQAFSFSNLVTAYEKISDHDLQYGTEVLHLAQEYAGTRAMLLETEDEVWKVTYRRDFYAAEQFARERLSQVGVVADSCTKGISDVLEQKLRRKRLNFKLKCPSLSNLPDDTNAIIIIKENSGKLYKG